MYMHMSLKVVTCYELKQFFFMQLWREYRSVMIFNARLGTSEGAKSVICQEMLRSILSLHVSYDAELDSRGMLGYSSSMLTNVLGCVTLKSAA